LLFLVFFLVAAEIYRVKLQHGGSTVLLDPPC
jgi:hypothetical protein